MSDGRTRRIEFARRAWSRNWLRILLLACLYYVAARASLEVALVGRSVTPIWPPTGIALVALLIFGPRVWPGIALGAFLVNAPISPTLLAAGGITVGNTLAPLVAFYLLRRVGFRRELDRLRDAVALVVLAALVSMTVSASGGAAALLFSGAIAPNALASTWAVWWTGDAMGVLIFAPIFLTWRFPLWIDSWRRRAEFVAALTGAAIISSLVMQSRLRLLYLVFPFVGWAAWRFRQRGAALASLLVSATAIWAAVAHSDAFAHLSLFDEMVTLQAFNATIALTSLVLATIVTERARDRVALQTAAVELEDRVRERTAQLASTNSELEREMAVRVASEGKLRHGEALLAEAQRVAHLGSWEWDIASNRVTWSDEMYRIYGYSNSGFEIDFSKAMERVVIEDRGRIQDNISGPLSEGRDYEFPGIEYRIRLPDQRVRILFGKGRLFCRDGKPVRMIGSVQDVTEQREAEETAIKLGETRLRHKQALELNDEVVQGLAVAKYALDVGDSNTAGRALVRTLASARKLIDDLLHGDEDTFGPGDLVRDRPASVIAREAS